MESSMTSSASTGALAGKHTGWNPRLVGQVAVLLLVNVVVDTVITAPLIVLPLMLDAFSTSQPAWLSASALLAGAMWAPLLGRTADVHGKRKVLVGTLVVACVGGFACMLAPNLPVFVLGRVVQGAAVGALFLTVSIVNDLCAPRLAMIITGFVTTGNAIFGVAFPFLFEFLGEQYGYQAVFIVSGSFAAIAALMVRFLLPESSIRTPGRIDVVGALLLGGGLAAVVSYVSLGTDHGWFGAIPLTLAVIGVLALAGFVVLSRLNPEPVIDISNLGRPLVLTLLVVVLGTGAYQSMLQLFSLLSEVPSDLGLGYGLAGDAALGLLLGLPAIGIVLGGVLAGVIATRIGPVATLGIGVALGTTATVLLYFAVSSLPFAVACSFLLSLTAGTLVTSGFNTAAMLASPERQATVSSLVMVVIAIGSVMLNFIGGAVLQANQVVVGGESLSSSRGVATYVSIGIVAFVLSGLLAIFLIRQQRAARRSAPPQPADVPAPSGAAAARVRPDGPDQRVT
jgi:MFS family permease